MAENDAMVVDPPTAPSALDALGTMSVAKEKRELERESRRHNGNVPHHPDGPTPGTLDSRFGHARVHPFCSP
jgi:hypothetical protein